MARDASLAFAQNLIENFTRFKILQFQLEKEDRRERRYEQQLQENQRRFDIRIGLEETRLAEQKEQFGTTQAATESRFARGQELTREGQELTREGQEATQGRFESTQALTREGMEALEKRFATGQELDREQMANLQSRFETTQKFREEQALETKIYRERTGDRLEDLAESLIESRGHPKRGVKDYYLEQGYSEDEAQLAQDRYNKLAPPMFTPQQKVTVGKMMMENPLTTDMYNSGRKIMEEGMSELQSQNIVFPSEDNVETERIEVRNIETGELFTLPRNQLEQSLAEGFELVEK